MLCTLIRRTPAWFIPVVETAIEVARLDRSPEPGSEYQTCSLRSLSAATQISGRGSGASDASVLVSRRSNRPWGACQVPALVASVQPRTAGHMPCAIHALLSVPSTNT